MESLNAVRIPLVETPFNFATAIAAKYILNIMRTRYSSSEASMIFSSLNIDRHEENKHHFQFFLR